MVDSVAEPSRQVTVEEGTGAEELELELAVVDDALEVVEEDTADELGGWLAVEELETAGEVVGLGQDCRPRNPQGVLAAAGAVEVAAVVVDAALLVVVGTTATVVVVVLGQPPNRQFSWRFPRRWLVRRAARELSSRPTRSSTLFVLLESPATTFPRIESAVKSAAPRRGRMAAMARALREA